MPIIDDGCEHCGRYCICGRLVDEDEEEDAAPDVDPVEALPRPSADTIIAMAAELPPRTFRVWLDAHDG